MRPHEIVESALAAGTVTGMTVICQEHSQTNLRWAANTLTTNGVMRSRDLTVIALDSRAEGTAAGVASASVTDAADVAALVTRAEAAARASSPAPDANPLTAARVEGAFDLAPEETSPAVFDAFAPALGDWFGRAREHDIELFGFAEHDVTTTYLGNSEGLRLRHVQPTGRVEITGKADQRTASTWAGVSTRDFSDVDVEGLDADVRTRLGWARRTMELEPGRYDVVLPPSAVADLLVYLYWSGAAREAAEGRTVFSRPGGGTRIGERLTEVPLTMFSDPQLPGIQCAPFVVAHASGSEQSVFDNGLPLQRTPWIDHGVLTSLGQTRHSVTLAGGSMTPMVDNLALEAEGASGSLDDLVRGTERGLLLTTLWYIREVDPQTLLLTGLTRDGVYLVEAGEVVGAVNNFRFNESPVDLLARVTGVGDTQITLPREWSDFFTRVAMPPLRVHDFNMSTVSQAS